MDSIRQMGTRVVGIVKSTDLVSLAKDFAEIGVDSVLSEGILRDIPVVNTVLAVARVGLSIPDRIFAKKLQQFLTSLAELSPQDRASMVDRLDEEESFRHQVGDRLIELLDRIDSHLKPEMVARAFRAYAANSIDIDMLNRLNHAIERLPHYEIKYVRQFHVSTVTQRKEIAAPTLGALVTAGLAKPIATWRGLSYEATAVCEAFVSVGLDQ